MLQRLCFYMFMQITYTYCYIFIDFLQVELDFVVRKNVYFWIFTNLEERLMGGTKVTDVLDIINDKPECYAAFVRSVGPLSDHGGLYLGGAALHCDIIEYQTSLKPTTSRNSCRINYFGSMQNLWSFYGIM